MADESVLIESIIEYKAQGTGDVLADAGKIDAELQKLEQGATIGVDLNLTDRAVLNNINALDTAKLTPTIDVSMPDDSAVKRVEALDTANVTPTVKPSMPSDQPVQRVEDLDSATVTPTVDAQESEGSKDITDKLDALTKLEVIDLAINLTGTAQAFFDKFGRIGGFTGLIEMDTELSKIEARTGRMIPIAEKLIHDLYRDGWGESREQIADVITEADNLRISQDNLQSAVQNALILQEVYGIDTAESLATMDSLVKNKLAPDFEAAADIIVAAQQTGINKGGDFQDVIREFSPAFARMGLSGSGAMALLNSGLAVGFDNSSRVAEGVRELGNNLANIKTDPNIAAAFNRLDSLSDIDLKGMLDAYTKGELSGDDFFNGFFAALADASAKNPARAQEIANTLIGTQASDFGAEHFGGLTTNWDTSLGRMEGRAQTAGTTIKNNISSQLDELWRTIETAAGDFLSSDQINLDAKIEEIKGKITEAINVLQSGGTLGEALEVGFQIQGVDEFLGNFQRVVGNLVLAIMEFIASLQSGQAQQQTRAQIANLAAGQLAFDLKLANPDEVQFLIQQAMDRGVDASKIAEAVNTAGQELISTGDLGKAQELVQSVQNMPQVFAKAWGALGITVDTLNIAQDTSPEEVQAQLDEFTRRQGIGVTVEVKDFGKIDVDALAANTRSAVDAANQAFIDAYNSGDFNLARQIANDLDDPALLSSAFNGALEAGDFDVASAIVGDLQDNQDFLTQAFEQAVTAGAPEVATKIADILNDPTLEARAAELALAVQEAKDAVTIGMDGMAKATEDADVRIEYAVSGGSIVPEFLKMRDAALINFPLIGAAETILANVSQQQLGKVSSWAKIAVDSLMGFGNVLPILDSLITKLGQASAAASSATAAVNGVPSSPGGGTQAFAEGGIFVAGERGPELISSDTDLAILNNRTTEAFLAGQRSVFTPLFGAQASNVVNNSTRNVTVQQTFIVQSQAQADSAAQQTANNLRGF